MPDLTVEQRISALEHKVADLMVKSPSSLQDKDWRSTIGMFAGNDLMKVINEEGRKIREADREQANSDHP